MSGSFLTVAGGNAQNGQVSVQSSLPSDINSLLQSYLTNVANSIYSGNESYIYNNVAQNSTLSGVGTDTANTYEVITNVDPQGNSVAGSGSYVVGVPSAVTQLVVQAPGNTTLAGSSNTTLAVFGSESNVTYNVSGGAGSIFAAGGNDAINVTGNNTKDTVFSGGNDTVTFNGISGQDSVNAIGNATTSVYLGGSDLATVTASDNAAVSVHFLKNSGSNVDFINNSTQVATVYASVQTVAGGGLAYSTNAVTAFGGSAGIFAVGGRSGFNSLNGGTGSSTLVGGGYGDTLMAGFGSTDQTNFLFAGAGDETLLGSGTGTTNIFEVGFQEPGIGVVTADGAVVSAGGATNNVFGIGNVQATTITGSTVQGASNSYLINGTFNSMNWSLQGAQQGNTVQGGSLDITDFGGNSTISLINPSSAGLSVESVVSALGGSGTQILLSDNTVITLNGVSTSQINVSQNGTTITFV